MAFEPAPYPIPVWKRKHNVDPVVLQRGAVEQKKYTNAMGTAVTTNLCKAVLMNENQKISLMQLNVTIHNQRTTVSLSMIFLMMVVHDLIICCGEYMNVSRKVRYQMFKCGRH